MTYRDESNNGAVNQANDEFEMVDAVDGAEALDLDTDIARDEFDEGFRGEQGADVDALEQVEAVESMARTERDHAGREITEEAVRIAGLEYDQDLQEGDVPFAQLDRADQIRYTKAAIAFNDEVLSAQQLMRVFGEIADGARQQASQPQRAVEEAGAVAQVQGAVPAGNAREVRQEARPAESRAVAQAAGAVQSPAVERAEGSRAEGAGQETDAREEVTDAREEVTDAVDSATAGFGEGNRYSKRADAESSLLRAVEQWKEVVAKLAAGVLDAKRYPTLFASTPASMQVLGIPDLPVLAKSHMLNYLNQRFTRGQLENLPLEMADPVTVLMHEETDGTLSFNFVTRDTSANGYITVALQPNSNDPRGGHANYTATVVTLPQRTILRELREGRAAYVGDLSVVEGAAAAFQQGKRESGKEAVKFRESISRKFRLPAALKKVAYKSDLVKLIEDGRAQYSRTTDTQGTTVEAVWSAITCGDSIK